MRILESKCEAHKLIARFNAQQTYVSGAFEATWKLQENTLQALLHKRGRSRSHFDSFYRLSIDPFSVSF